MAYELVHKPTFTTQLLALPSAEIPRILQKISMLETFPQPDAKNKKRLKGYKEAIYRIRAGTYRILYTFGEGWVALLGVDHRKDVYDGDDLVAEAPAFDVALLPAAEGLFERRDEAGPHHHPPEMKPAHTTDDDLPIRLDADLLRQMRIPDQHHAAIIVCKTLEDLTNADIPESTRMRVFDVAYTPNYDLVLDQPSFETGEVDDLLRYVEGELLDFLLKLDPEQEKYVTWALNGAGPTLVKGSPGTGKSTIALYRVKSLLESLKAAGVEKPKILFTTYTNALVSSSRQLLTRMLGGDADGVKVQTADALVTHIYRYAGNREKVLDNDAIEHTLMEASREAQTDMSTVERRMLTLLLERLSISYMEEEVEDLIVARELETLDEYLQATRAGRKVGLTKAQRTAIWKLHESWTKLLTSRNLTTWARMRRAALDAVREGVWEDRFDGVIVDESQDLQPTVLRLLVSLCTSSDRLFVTADANQSIYGSSFRWTDVHQDLRFTGRTGVLRRNHRSTKEIGEATQSYLQAAVLEGAEPQTITYVATGPFPTVRSVSSDEEETDLLVRYLKHASREFRLGFGGCAVLVPGSRVGQALAERLTAAGVNAEFMSGRNLDLESKKVKVITQRSAKGLEFPVVVVAGLLEWPKREPVTEEEAQELEEALLRDQRTLFVAMTRAMRALLVVLPAGHSTALFDGFDATLWNVATRAVA